LLDKVGGTRVGEVAGVWTLVSPVADDASITLHLQRGTIYVDGRIRHDAKASTLRVVGGTDAYDHARGKGGKPEYLHEIADRGPRHARSRSRCNPKSTNSSATAASSGASPSSAARRMSVT
jgi:hypothetical protein